ncbi:hypothetical protein AHAS_Ahas09G0129800 [Arachis hypogaea]
MIVCSQEAALPLWRAEQEMVRAALVACMLGASGCCPALGEIRAVVSWCAFCPCVLGAGHAKLCARPSSFYFLEGLVFEPW